MSPSSGTWKTTPRGTFNTLPNTASRGKRPKRFSATLAVNGSEPSNRTAQVFGDIDRQVHHGHLGRGVERPPDHLSGHSLRSRPAPREEAMSQTDSKPALSPEQQAAVEAIRARSKTERAGPDELIDRGDSMSWFPTGNPWSCATRGAPEADSGTPRIEPNRPIGAIGNDPRGDQKLETGGISTRPWTLCSATRQPWVRTSGLHRGTPAVTIRRGLIDPPGELRWRGRAAREHVFA